MDGYLDASKDGFAGRIEVIEGRMGRRRWSSEEKARIAAASFARGARVADVARQHGTTRWQVYDWRRQLLSGALVLPSGPPAAPAFAALVVETPTPVRAPVRKKGPTTAPAVIEVVVDGIVIRSGAEVDEAHLARVIRAVRAAAR